MKKQILEVAGVYAKKHKPSILVFGDWTLHNAFDWIHEGEWLTHPAYIVGIIGALVIGVEIFEWLKE